MSDLQKFELSNGVRVLVEPVTAFRSVAIGLTCATGSRHELEHEAGITHFIEHMMFKGTAKRNAKDIAGSIEGLGGMLNAFTDKEQTTYYCRMLSDDTAVGLDVLSDMLANSLHDAEEMEREKGVVLEEIRRSEDEPGDHVHELHFQSRWGEHQLGKPIIGTAESVSGYSRDDILGYLKRRYTGGNILLSVAGNVDPNDVKARAEDLLGGFEPGGGKVALDPPSPAVKKNEIAKEVEQVHFCIGGDSLPIGHDDAYVVAVLDAILGGGMSSRLFQEVRERRGLAYSVGSYNAPYTSAGLFTIYGGTSLDKWDLTQEVIRTECQKLMNEPVPAEELAKIKRQMAGNIVLGQENLGARMLRQTKNELHHGREITMDEVLKKIDKVTTDDLMRIAHILVNPETQSVTAIGPF
jgi:predicted Zn-dependent peptidase